MRQEGESRKLISTSRVEEPNLLKQHEEAILIFDSSSTPRLWVKRLVIFKSLNPLTIIRDISLKRGLNLIVGESADQVLMDNPMAMAGHSVGKTTFCRLLRYCLGEEHFATETGGRRIRSCLGHSWVGAELEIEAVPWAVLRPLGAQNALPSAQESSSIEDLISTAEEGSGFFEFRQELGKLLPIYVHHPETIYKWEHLLAWLARDQECRFRKFEIWRDSDSYSGTSGFRKPKEYPVHLVRSMLDLVVPEESEWSKKHSDLVQQQKQLKEQQSIASQEADYAYRESCKRLAEFVGDFPDTRQQAQLKFDDPAALTDTHKKELLRQCAELEAQLAETEQKLFDEKKCVADALRHKNYFANMLAVTPQPEPQDVKIPISDAEKRKRDLNELNAQIEMLKDCPLANFRALKSCIHVTERIAELQKASRVINLTEHQRSQVLQKMAEPERQNIQAIIKHLDDSERALVEAKQKTATYEAELKDIWKQLSSINIKIDRLDRALQDFRQAEKFSIGGVMDSELQVAKENLEKVDSEVHYAKDQLDFYRAQSAKQDEGLQKIFNNLVQRILKADYSGSVVTSAEDFSPQILKNGEASSGAAHSSLSVVLLDIAATLGASTGIGKHPAFLVHDSPREADLDIWPYHSFLAEIAAISAESGGEDNAPFQYIVTTTTKPPAGLESLTRLSLAAYPEDRMLFKQQLKEKHTFLEA